MFAIMRSKRKQHRPNGRSGIALVASLRFSQSIHRPLTERTDERTNLISHPDRKSMICAPVGFLWCRWNAVAVITTHTRTRTISSAVLERPACARICRLTDHFHSTVKQSPELAYHSTVGSPSRVPSEVIRRCYAASRPNSETRRPVVWLGIPPARRALSLYVGLIYAFRLTDRDEPTSDSSKRSEILRDCLLQPVKLLRRGPVLQFPRFCQGCNAIQTGPAPIGTQFSAKGAAGTKSIAAPSGTRNPEPFRCLSKVGKSCSVTNDEAAWQRPCSAACLVCVTARHLGNFCKLHPFHHLPPGPWEHPPEHDMIKFRSQTKQNPSSNGTSSVHRSLSRRHGAPSKYHGLG